MKHVALLGLLSLSVPSAELAAQSTDSPVQATLETINQILHDHPAHDPSVNWQRQQLDVRAGQLVLTIFTHGLDGSVQAVRWTARVSDVQRAVASKDQVLIPCRNNASCAQLWEGLEEGHPLTSRSAALTLDISAAPELVDRLLSACQRLGDLVAAGAPSDVPNPSGGRPN